MRWAILVLGLLGLSACATTNPQSAAGIDYRLPRTDAKITLGIDVTRCTPDLKIATSLKIDAVAGVQDEVWHIAGSDLGSGVTKRGLTIDVDANGVLSSVNATATDQQTVLLGNIIKIAAVAAPFAASEGINAVLMCNPSTIQNLAAEAKFQARIDDARSKLPAAVDIAAAQKQIDSLAAQLASAKNALHQETTATLKLDTSLERKAATDKNGANLDFDLAPFKSLFDTAYVGRHVPMDKQKPSPGVNQDTQAWFSVIAYYIGVPAAKNGLSGSNAEKPSSCKLTMTVSAAKMVKVVLERTGNIVKGDADTPDKEVAQTMPASQLYDSSKLCLSANFGENRVVGLKFDKFGQTTEFAWTSDARAANVTSALAGATPDVSTIVTALRDHDLTADKRELDHLTTEQSLRKARACQALLDAGASSCPSN